MNKKIIFLIGFSIIAGIILIYSVGYERYPNQYPEIDAVSFSDIPEITNYKGESCNMQGFTDVNCFVDSFNNCSSAKIESSEKTIEGDPILFMAMIKSENKCTIDVFRDATKDQFGGIGITKYTCNDIKLDENYLHIIQCVKKSGKEGYFGGFSFRR